jgi:hypothetical protein
MGMHNAPNRPRNVLRKALPQAKVDTSDSRDVSKSSFRTAFRKSTAKLTTFAAKLVSSFWRRKKDDGRCQEIIQPDQKGIMKVSSTTLEAEASLPERSALASAVAAQILLEENTPKTHLSLYSDISSTDSGSETFSEPSPTSTMASEPPTINQLGALSPPPPVPALASAPESLTEVEQYDLEFAHLRAIPSALIKSVLLKHIDPTKSFTNPRVRVQRRTEGASHHVVMLQFGPADLNSEWVIKIPVTGTKERWNEELAHKMRCEAMLMKYIKRTDLPVPRIHTVIDTINNELGAPYILMKRMPGKGAYHLWFDKDDEDHLNANYPSPETEKKRETFLRSLAHHMAKLQELQFDKIGMLDLGDAYKDCDEYCDHPVVGHFYETVDGKQKEREPFASAHGFLTTVIEEQ